MTCNNIIIRLFQLLTSALLMSTSTAAEARISWRSLLETSIARSRKVRGGNYVSLATVEGHSGKPRCRTVVMRGFTKTGNKSGQEALRMITDARSEKVDHIGKNPWGELVYWFGKTNEQYRISGRLELIGDNESDEDLDRARRQQWGNLRDASRDAFFDPRHPGVPYVEGAHNEEGCNSSEAPSNFLLCYFGQLKLNTCD